MKKLALAILLVASPAFAAAWTVNTGDAADKRFDRNRLSLNAATCASVGLAADCTQGQARTAQCVRDGQGAITTCPGAIPIIVYTDLSVFHKREMLGLAKERYAAQAAAEAKAAREALISGWTQAQKDAQCAAWGLDNGCLD